MIKIDKLIDSITSYLKIRFDILKIDLIEKEEFPKSKYIGEPFLSKRNIYPYLGGGNHYKKSRIPLIYLKQF